MPAAPKESLGADQQAEHTDHLGAFDVDGQGIEVVDLNKRFGPDRMGHRPHVFTELLCAHEIGILNPFDAGRVMVGAELLFTEYRETFLEAELEPVAQGHAVAGPVMQVLMTDDIPNRAIVMVSRGRRLCKNIAGIEDIESFVLHGTHVEVFDRNNVVLDQVILTPIHLLIPDHRVAKRAQGKVALRDIP